MGAGAPAASSIRGAGGPAAASGARSLSGPDPSILRARYLRALRQRVLARREYPHAAQRAGLQGTVCLRFSLNAQGRLSALQASCGPAPEPLLQAALRAVRAAEPFGPLPSALGRELTVDLPVIFRLDEP
jgi:TonB family protein